MDACAPRWRCTAPGREQLQRVRLLLQQPAARAIEVNVHWTPRARLAGVVLWWPRAPGWRCAVPGRERLQCVLLLRQPPARRLRRRWQRTDAHLTRVVLGHRQRSRTSAFGVRSVSFGEALSLPGCGVLWDGFVWVWGAMRSRATHGVQRVGLLLVVSSAWCGQAAHGVQRVGLLLVVRAGMTRSTRFVTDKNGFFGI